MLIGSDLDDSMEGLASSIPYGSLYINPHSGVYPTVVNLSVSAEQIRTRDFSFPWGFTQESNEELESTNEIDMFLSEFKILPDKEGVLYAQ